MAFGASGTSILMSSGDGGVGGSQPTNCTTFVPTFPSTCPFVTSVGGTDRFSPEVAASFSSGGFSNFFSTPSYQTSSVQQYLARIGNQYQGRFNPKGRAFPDISAQGTNIPIFNGGQTGNVAGTSASTPIFASIIALINDRRAAAGKPPVGFLNPAFYSAGNNVLTDITNGTNPGCGTPGFSALPGWDPVTGYGTPVFSKLVTLFGA